MGSGNILDAFFGGFLRIQFRKWEKFGNRLFLWWLLVPASTTNTISSDLPDYSSGKANFKRQEINLNYTISEQLRTADSGPKNDSKNDFKNATKNGFKKGIQKRCQK